MMKKINTMILVGAALGSPTVGAVPFTDSAGDFLSTYTGPHGGDLDVVSANVTFTGTVFRFDAVLNGPVGATAGGFYVWGIDRGFGTPRFGVITGAGGATYDATGVLFDSVVVLRPGGASVVNDLLPGGASTPLPIASIIVNGSEILADVPASLLPSSALPPSQYRVNLWPRFAGAVGNNQISDFAPDNSTIQVSAVGEPPSLALLSLSGLALLGFNRVRRARTSTLN